MPIQKSDFILVDYTGTVKETGEVFDTTSEEIAKEKKLFKEGDIYEPRLIVVGEGWVLKALDEAFLNFKLKKTETVEIAPENAFGPRDPEKIRLVPLKRLAVRGLNPRVGEQIEYDKRLATVRTMGSGRVTLDFNPPLAGKTLVYEVSVNQQLKTNEEKISALIHRRIPAVEQSKVDFKVGKTDVTFNMPEESFYIEGIQLAKRGITFDIKRYLPELTTVKFVETFAEPEPEPEPKKTAKKAAKKPAKKAAAKSKAKKVTTAKPKSKAATATKTKAKAKAKPKAATKSKAKAKAKTKTAKKSE